MEVELDDLVECGRRELEERPFADRCGGDVAARGVDERVDPAPAIEHHCAGTFELGGVEHVGLEDDRRLAEAPRERLERLASSSKEGDPCACCGESARDSAAENARRAGHHRDLVLETGQFRDGSHHAGQSLRRQKN